MKIVLWHGYLLGGTGSNVYTRALAREWSRAGHEVVVLSQEPHPEQYDLGGARHLRPDIDGLLPVFVLDRYEGHEPRLLPELSREERDRYVETNAAAVRAELPADLVFANHVLLGGPVGAASGARYAVKAHGSELEYAMRGNPELQAWGRESLAGAEAVFVGSQHIRRVLEEVVGHVDRVHEVPPGVDVDEFRPRPREAALAGLLEEARRDPPNPGNASERLPDEGNAERLAAFLEADEPTVVYFGKLLYNKGVHLLLEALRELDARAVIVGFGDYREQLEAAGAGAHALHRPARASPSRASAPARGRDGRAVDFPGGVRHGRRRGRGRRLTAARRAPLRPRGDRRGAGGRVSARAPASHELCDRRRRRPGDEVAGAARPAAGRARTNRSGRAQGSRGPLELGGYRRKAAATLQLM